MPERLALFIGNSTYDDPTLTRLKTPQADVRALAAAFRDRELGEFDRVDELIDESEVVIRRSIADFFHRRHPDDMLVLYFSGHGVKDDHGRLYLAARDTSYTRLSATAIASGYVVQHMDECRSKRQILILDCCNSGAFSHGTKAAPTAMTADMFGGSGYGRVVLTASDSTQYALEGDRVIEKASLSLFTHYLVQGLVTGAASDNDTITLDELYDFAYGQVVSTTPGQTPRKWVYNQQGNLVIARNPRRQPGESKDRSAQNPADHLASTAGHPTDTARSTVDLGERGAAWHTSPPHPGTRPGGMSLEERALTEPTRAAPDLVDLIPVGDLVARLTPRGAWILAIVLALALNALVTGGLLQITRWDFTSKFFAGSLQGALLAAFSYVVMRKLGYRISARDWFVATIVAEIIRWQIPFGTDAVQRVTYTAAFTKGLLDGLIYGIAQGWALRATLTGRALWTGACMIGWGAANIWFIASTVAFWPSLLRAPLFPSTVIGAVSGLIFGAATSLALPLVAGAQTPATSRPRAP